MGQLPDFRLERSVRPFAVTGVDYFGPMEVKIGRRREKRYGALFTCMNTRAVHLELAESLDTDAAIMAIRRFVARRGCPSKMLSDNGTNFHGADNEMKKAIKELDTEKMQAEFAAKGMEWQFNPPSAPHMGGCWERLVQSVKKALKATLKEMVPKEAVLQTLLVEAENIVNSRPLTHVSVDPDDPESLTPNHFLIGSSSGNAAPGKFVEMDLCLRKQWRIAQRLVDRFWKRWVQEYLPTLTRRTKWFRRTAPVKIGDLVFIADGNLPRNQWPRGLVVGTSPDKEGQVRVAEVKTQFGMLTRPVVKLCVLDILTKSC
jgi:transposase InsO family protein